MPPLGSVERDNLWAALDCLRNPGELVGGAELAQDLSVYWICRGPYGDVRRILAALIDVAPADSLPRARLQWVAGAMAATQNDHEACAALCQDSLRIGTLLKDAEVIGWSGTYLGIAHWFTGDLAEAVRLTESAVALAGLMQLAQLEVGAMNSLTNILLARGDLDHVLEVGGQALDKSETRGELSTGSV